MINDRRDVIWSVEDLIIEWRQNEMEMISNVKWFSSWTQVIIEIEGEIGSNARAMLITECTSISTKKNFLSGASVNYFEEDSESPHEHMFSVILVDRSRYKNTFFLFSSERCTSMFLMSPWEQQIDQLSIRCIIYLFIILFNWRKRWI